MFGIGFGEALLLAIIVFFLFGAKRLPQLGSSLGLAINNFKKGLNGSEEEKKQIETKNS